MKRSVFQELKNLSTAGFGAESPELEVVQSLLRKKQHLCGDYKSGVLDKVTALALKSYQKEFGLPETGDLDPSTLEVLGTPRCGMRDRGLSLTEECRWQTNQLSYSFENFTPDVTESVARASIARAFQTWTAKCDIVFTEVDPSDPHDISIGWRDAHDPDYDLVGADIAHADYPGTCSEVNPNGVKPIHFDGSECSWTDDENWHRNDDSDVLVYDIETVALHEIGHILGLMHSPIPGDVLYGAIPRQVQRILSSNDVLRIRHLYELT